MLRAFRPSDVAAACADMVPFSSMEFERIGLDPEPLVLSVAKSSTEVKTIEHEGVVLVVGGVRGATLLSNEGALWAIFTNASKRFPITTMRGLRAASAASTYKRLWSNVDEACYGWVEKLGFQVGEPKGAFRDIWRN